jgi:hypothetical protein
MVELRSTWQGYCLYHYLEVTDQLNNPDFIFEYAGYKYQWADPPEHLKKPHQNRTKTAPLPVSKTHIILYILILGTIATSIIVYIQYILKLNLIVLY